MARYVALLCVLFTYALGEAWGGVPASRDRRSSAISSVRRLQPSQESISDLALELAKQQLLSMIIAKHAELTDLAKSIHSLQKDDCTNIKAVGKPVTHRFGIYTEGAWMKDPLGCMGTETIFVMERYYGNNILKEYKNLEAFKSGVERKTYVLPYRWDGTGAVIYGPFLFFNRENTNYIVKYDLRKETMERQVSFSRYSTRSSYYQSSRYSGMDFAVDEQGLWVLSGYSNRLYASKLDINTLSVVRYWSIPSEKMNTMGNAFVACGVVYCIDSYSSNPTTINFAYDTKTGKSWNPNIEFNNQYGCNTMVDYNPREKMLYAWDNKHQVTYSLTFEKQG